MEPLPSVEAMASLHIEHPVTDLATWTAAFGRFAEIRRRAGVTAETVRHPEGDDAHVVIDLEFDTTDQAHTFLTFLRAKVWAVPEHSPALVGTPEARVLVEHLTTTQLRRGGVSRDLGDQGRRPLAVHDGAPLRGAR